ncbi:ShlB/FhaC/HecB family hemolysin secretion/activation protein [Sulfuriferula sp.]|uniref:ShlB/FhaC/HecB family hemolysin secretion/activation protein n=1 Tax=Sulfuriferula sp. TaxID=2025307 RepID=UPI00272F9F2C|nr:POTRA domain-containing protein [Sulfuriferula sp.]MDP2027810.1 POTRA domain-containing protein [Sulfuriferula sp.]
MNRQNPFKRVSWVFFSGLLLASPVVAADAVPTDAATPAPQADVAQAPAADAAASRRFNVMEYRVAGNTVLPNLAIEEAVYPWLGESKTIADIDQARASLEKAYRDAGYLTVLVDIPEQQVEGGIVTLQVTEGKVARTRVVGSHYFSQGRILAKTPELAEGSVPYFPAMQKQIASVNTTADRRVTPVLKPGKTPGTIEVDLKVDDKLPVHGSLELNNRYSANTTPWRLSGMVRYDNLWQREHSLALQYQIAPENVAQSNVLSATYVMPLGTHGNMLALYAVRSRSNVAVLGDLSVLGNGNIYGVREIVPLPSTARLFHSFTLGADYKDFKESLVLQGADSIKTPISYLAFVLGYSATLQNASAQTQANINLNFAPRGLGNTTQEFDNKRYKAQPNYVYLKADVTHTRKLFDDYSLITRLGGQLSDMPLVSNEQYGAGGAESVRGYLESEALGDNAVLGSLEVHTPSYARQLPDSIDELYLLAFTEGAVLRILDPLPQQDSSFVLSSAGIGVRLKAVRHLTSALDVAWPFKSTVNTRSGEPRVHFKLFYEF